MHVLSDWIIIPAEYEAFVENFFRFAEDKATLLNVAAIPIFAFFSFVWLSGRKYNFAENLILNTYITAQQLFFLVILIPCFEIFPGSKTGLIGTYTAAVILYNIWVYVQFFGTNVSTVIKSFFVVVVSYIYQFPFNFLIYYMYDQYVHHHMHWIPEVYDNIIN
jgi:hypothetical protein